MQLKRSKSQTKAAMMIDADQQIRLTKEMRTLLKVTFDSFDANHSRSIDFSELKNLIKILGVNFSRAQIQEIFKEIDEDESGTIEFDEFLKLMQKYFVY